MSFHEFCEFTWLVFDDISDGKALGVVPELIREFTKEIRETIGYTSTLNQEIAKA